MYIIEHDARNLLNRSYYICPYCGRKLVVYTMKYFKYFPEFRGKIVRIVKCENEHMFVRINRYYCDFKFIEIRCDDDDYIRENAEWEITEKGIRHNDTRTMYYRVNGNRWMKVIP